MSVQCGEAEDVPDPSEPAPAADPVAGADALVRGLLADPWGQVSPSIYETGRVVTLAPWLIGHTERLRFLLAAQRADGGWGAPGGYSLVPTLSATEAILSAFRRDASGTGRDGSGIERDVLAKAADRGLQALTALLDDASGDAIPDMPAVELISAHLARLINDHLEWLDARPPGASGPRPAGARVRAPESWADAALDPLRELLSAGGQVPEKLFHALEVAGPAARRTGSTRPGPRTGGVGASPAATAAWIGGDEAPPADDPARRFLETVAAHHGGPVPCGYPITVFERAWVLSGLRRTGVPVTVPDELTASLAAAVGPLGTPAGEGLPADADTTSVTLYALALLGSPREPDSLLAYELDDRFCTWQGEQGASVTTNAHVLDAFGEYARLRPAARARYAPAMAKAASWLRARQEPDGSWTDRWHVSPYYATACAVQALQSFGGAEAAASVERARRWVTETQRPDGSWGWWDGTAEETAEAMLVLLPSGRAGNGSARRLAHLRAAARGRAWLLRSPHWTDGPALWHDKDLYLPKAIVHSTILSALHLTRPE
ncbi:prenyltransferase/squalene oxidase repeat-containing protein [Actinomadura geliboluensis]|uniref:Squalene cyclase C-terminal domain-containing protein n=1 Tax=Actinomadura geliboluensis TaxID=882440 RepID=A0A5S4G5W5_9ACTN|nr:prenyltransferase/squalene oxidase repeat-containing protein [Actinomadura geliboluensis]TMR27904.1 hypothetical protein ETD96_38525 [Actinomadura geliboluensis]